MTAQADSVHSEDIDFLISALESYVFIVDNEFLNDIDILVKEIEKDVVAIEYVCTKCTKKCRTQRGLTRHVKTKHPENAASTGTTAELVCSLTDFRSFIEKSVSILKDDLCYPSNIREEFSNYEVSFADAQHFFLLVNDVIADFNGNAERFYPKFYKVVGQEGYFNNLTKRCSLLVGYELANHVLSHITNSTVSDIALKFLDKENVLISYLSGYVFGTFYRRISHSKVWQGRLGQECLSTLMAGKLNESSNPITTTTDIHQKFVDAKN